MDNYHTLFFENLVYQDLKIMHVPATIVLADNSKFSQDTLQVLGIDNFIEFFKSTHANTDYLKTTIPYIICTGCFSISYFDNMLYDQQTVDHINTVGLEIYLYEELQINLGIKLRRYIDQPSELSNDEYYQKYNFCVTGFESTAANIKAMYSFELESIKTFVKNNKLTNVTVNCCSYNVENYFQKQYPMFKIKNKNIYVDTKIKNLSKINNIISPETNNVLYKFLSLNSRYKGFRHLTAGYLCNRNSLISFDHTKSMYGRLQNQLWFDISQWKKTNKNQFLKLAVNLKKLKDVNPLIIDCDLKEMPNPNFNYNFDHSPADVFKKCFCSVITETDFSRPIAAFTEKTLNAINNFHPFILVAPPNTLRYLKSYGFKTFDTFWDESYDLEENHEKRLIKIFQLIDYIDSKSLDYLKNMYKLMTPILLHNYKVIRKLSNE